MSIIKNILDNDLVSLKSYLEEKIGEKIEEKITDRKTSILAKMNGMSDEQVLEMLASKD